MNYFKLYTSIIDNRLNHPINGYVEKHHILPQSLGGGNEKENLVKLTAKEHFICHLLLTKIYKKDKIAYKKMVKAFGMMLWMHGENQKRYKVSSRSYQHLKEEFAKFQSEEQTGSLNSHYGCIWITDGTINKTIKGSEDIPEGWSKGRNLSSLRIKHFCQNCKIELSYRKRGNYQNYCEGCEHERKRSNATPVKNCVICDTAFYKRKVKTCSEKCKGIYI